MQSESRYLIASMNVRNFKCLEEVDLNFCDSDHQPRRNFTIFGPQGSGKSTIGYAMAWCAYGTMPTGRFSLQNIQPISWDHGMLNEISVTLRMRPADMIDGSKDILLTRKISRESKTDQISVQESTETIPPKSALSWFRTVFGKNSDLQAIMWLIRRDEIGLMASTLRSKGRGTDASYFLDFVNLESFQDSLAERIATLREHVANLKSSSNGSTNSLAILREAEQRKIMAQEQLDEANNRRIQHMRSLADLPKLTTQERRILDHKDQIEVLKNIRDQAEKSFATSRLDSEEFGILVEVLLFKALDKSMIEVEQSTMADKFDWKQIADFLRTRSEFPSNIVDRIESLSDGLGLDTTRLRTAKDEIELMKEKLRNIQQYSKELNEAKFKLDFYESGGLTVDQIDLIVIKEQEHKLALEKGRNLQTQCSELEKELDLAKRNLRKKQKDLEKDEQTEDLLKGLVHQLSIAEALSETIKITDRDYIGSKLRELSKGIQEIWNEVDPHGVVEPIFDREKELLGLRDKNGRIISLSNSESNPQHLSNGETQLLEVCACLAVAERSGARMPIILDDCTTEIDSLTQSNLLKFIQKRFSAAIFLTNDERKVEDMGSGVPILDVSKLEDRSARTDGNGTWGKWRV